MSRTPLMVYNVKSHKDSKSEGNKVDEGMPDVDTPPPGFLKLRVGGREFEASREVLLSEPDSVFTAVLSDAWASGATQQLVFDRDPDRFRVVLNWLRTRELVCEGGVSAEGVRAEADFFQLHSLGQEASRLVEVRPCTAPCLQHFCATDGNTPHAGARRTPAPPLRPG